MPTMDLHQSGAVTKMLMIGESGAGKTGSLLSLAKAGYNLRLLDLDNGADILFNLVRKEPALGKQIIYETVTEKMKTSNGRIIVDGVPKQFSAAMALLDHWKMPDVKNADGSIRLAGYDLGKVTSWGPQDVLIIDSLSRLSDAAMRFVLGLNNRSGQAPHQADWGQAMGIIENLLTLINSDAIRCNVIIMAHIVFLGGDEEGNGATGYPYTLGQKLPPKVASFFNSVVMVKAKSQGPLTKRTIVTQPEGAITVKNSAPATMPKELPQDTGLAEFFRIVRNATEGKEA